jgi:FAD:protein FMN transferase
MGTLATVAHHEAVMGTVVSLHVTAADPHRADEAIRDACARLHELDELLSLWKPQSPMSRVRSGELSLEAAPPELHAVLSLCRLAVELTGGWFDPWAMPGGVDPTGLAKGWALEDAARRLSVHEVDAAVLNCGGDMVLLGTPPGEERWRVGIQHPWRRDALAGIIEVHGAVATSGSYERGAHLLDPRTGEPALLAASATVVGDRLALADALATGLAVGGDPVLEAIASLDGYEAYLVRLDGSEAATDGVRFVGAPGARLTA